MAMLEVIGLLSVIVVILYYYVTKDHKIWESKGIPFEKPLPIMGNLLDTILGKRNQGQIYTEIYNKHKGAKVVGIFNFTTPALMVRDCDMVNRILTSDFQYVAYNDLEISEEVDPVLSKNMFSQRDEKWKRSRQALSPAFTIGRIKPAYPAIIMHVKKLVEWFEKYPETEVKPALSLFACEIFATTGAGIDGHSFTDEDPILPRLGEMIFGQSVNKAIKFLTVSYFPKLTRLFKLRIVPKEVPMFFDGMLRDVVRQREQSKDSRPDMLQHFIDIRKKRLVQKNDDQDDVTEDDIVAGLTTFFLESYETVPVVTSLLLYSLVKNPKIQTALREEVDALFLRAKGDPSLEEVLELPLLDRITMETTRVYGAQFLFKQCSKDYDLNIDDGKVLHIKKGSSIILPVEGIHHDSEYWEDADVFDPDHFLEERKANRRKNVYIPFGEGPRMCIGMRLAKTIMKTVAVYLVRNFEFVPTAKTAKKFEYDPLHFFTALKGGVYFKFVRRSHIG